MEYNYIVCHLGSTFPCAEVSRNTFYIYGDLKVFAGDIIYFFEQIDMFDGNPRFENEEEEFAELSAEMTSKSYNPSFEDVFEYGFNFFNTYLRLVLLTKDYRKFIDSLIEEFFELTEFTLDFGSEEEIQYAYEEAVSCQPIMEYLVPIKKSGVYPTEEEFLAAYEKYEDEINEGEWGEVLSLDFKF